MGNLAFAARLGLLLISITLAGGCAGRVPPDRPEDKQAIAPRSDANGYYEVNYQGKIYVVSDILTAEAIRGGKAPAVTSGGFGATGQPVFFEAGNDGRTQRLMAEYDRRHGLSR